ncbi:MAG: LytTR family DNA-binding domain-containing protein [Gelidibacter sp.]
MIKAVIIDDEIHCIDRIRQLLEPYKSIIQLVSTFADVELAIEGINAIQPDLLFLDVQIHAKTGFDVLKSIQQPKFEVIFTTAYEAYAVQAFKFSAVDYLLKPIAEDDFKQAIDKVTHKLETNDFSNKVEVLLSNLSKKDQHKKISIPTVEGYSFIEVSDIIRCQSDVNYTTIFTIHNKKIIVSKTLKIFEELLADCNFFRVHNSHLINLDYVKKYAKGKGGYVTMVDNTDIEVSTRRKDAFLKIILS